jgi:hypothetical protein
MFSGLAIFFSFAVLLMFAHRFSVAELWILWLGTLLTVRYVAHFIFHRMSYHRGIYHSILAGLFFAFFTAVIYRHLLGRPEGVAWLAAAFMFIGYLVHLTLDEIYSVDVMDTRIKASFGTALKFLDGKHPGHSTAMALAVVAAFWFTPSMKPLIDGLRSRDMWVGLHQRLLPKDRWFGVVNLRGRIVAGDAQHAPAGDTSGEAGTETEQPVSGLSTGSVDREPKSPQSQ